MAIEVLCKLAMERLTSRQKIIIKEVRSNESLSSLVVRISRLTGCSKTAVWNNINGLKRAGLIEARSLSLYGRIVRENIEAVDNNNKLKKRTDNNINKGVGGKVKERGVVAQTGRAHG